MQPESLLSAVKKTASAAKLPWPHVQKVYQALQAGDFLPKSRGREIWAAHPNFIARLLVALAGSDVPAGARRAVETFLWATENGEGGPGNLEDFLFRALSSEQDAADIESVEFFADTLRVCINTKSRGAVWFWIEVEELQRDGTAIPVEFPQALIRFRGVIDGELFRLLARDVTWRINGLPLTDEPTAADLDEDAE